tara:strand:+ start:75 stop:485 length:411 start_codon:yes stop_codon:yes gene_type:complete
MDIGDFFGRFIIKLKWISYKACWGIARFAVVLLQRKFNFEILQKVITLYLQKIKIMEASIIKIGNSKGLRLSKTILEKYHIKDKVELILEKGQIILRPIDSPRKNWEEKFKKMAENEDDQLLMNDVFDDENFEEWI